MRLRYSLIAEEKRWANCKTSGISFPCLISANRFSTTKVVNAFRSGLSSKSGEISSSEEEIRSSVCIVNLISRAVCAEHTPSGPWRSLSLACSPATCLTSTSQFSLKSLTSLILAIRLPLDETFSIGLSPSAHGNCSGTFEGSLRTPTGQLA